MHDHSIAELLKDTIIFKGDIMIRFLKPILRKTIPLFDEDNNNIGKISVRVARELVGTKHAKVIQHNPTIIGLKQLGRTSCKSNGKAVTNNPLKNLINIASLFTAKGSYKRILNTILFKVVNNRLCVTASDLESCFVGYLESGSQSHFACDGNNAVCINADSLKRILSNNDNIDSLRILGGNEPGLQIGSFFIKGSPADEFPEIPLPKGNQYSYTIADIAQKLAFVGLAVSTNRYNSVLSGIYFDLKQGQLVCADGNRLHMAPINRQNNLDKGIIIPPTLLKVAKWLDGQVTFVEHRNNEEVETDAIFNLNIPGCVLSTARYRSLDGQFPQYHEIIPKGFVSKFVANTRELLHVLVKAQMAARANDDHESVICAFTDRQLQVTLKHLGNIVYRGVVSGGYTGPGQAGQMNVNFLVDALRSLPDESVEIFLQKASNEAWTLRCNSGYTAVVMPIETDAVEA